MAGNPIHILAILLLTVAAADWLGRRRGFRHAGAAAMAILFGAVLANTGLLPVAADGIGAYDVIFTLVTPAAIFLVLLEANLASVRRAGPRMLFAFGAGAVGTLLGVLAAVAWVPLPDIGTRLAPLAGMFAATYIGGSANFNAVALEHGMEGEGTLYTAAIVVDNVMTMAWIVVTLLLPHVLRRIGGVAPVRMDAGLPDETRAVPVPLSDTLALALPLALAVAAVAVAGVLSSMAAAAGTRVPSILLVTTIALLLAQLPVAARMTLAKPLGIWGMYLFLAAVGASADLGALLQAGALGLAMFAFIGVILLVHLVVVVVFGLATRTDPDVIAIASTANIGGATTAFALAESFGRKDLVLPGILAGTLGTALGTYVGLALAGLL
jgi:uncharacterized membrane protein